MSETGEVQVVLMDDESGAILVASLNVGRRVRLRRCQLFLADGPTLWFDADHSDADHEPDAAWILDRGSRRLRLSTHAAEDLEPAEHPLAVDGDEFQVPLTANLLLEPISLAVTGRAAAGTAVDGAQSFRATGVIAAGSVIYQVRGQAWVSRGGTDELAAAGEATSFQIAFQDGSALLAVAPGNENGTAALQRNTELGVLSVAAVHVEGAKRRSPVRMIGQLRQDAGGTVFGRLRNVDQHLACVVPSSEGDRWVRRSLTPFDFVLAGVTGFGVLEQIDHVDTADPPEVIWDGPPDP